MACSSEKAYADSRNKTTLFVACGSKTTLFVASEEGRQWRVPPRKLTLTEGWSDVSLRQ